MSETQSKLKSLLLIAGLTGSGKTLAVQQLEQLGYVGVEALPPKLLLAGIPFWQAHYPRLAVVLDLRVREWQEDLPWLRNWLAERFPDGQTQLLFLEAADAVLVSRLSANRRPHPYCVHSPFAHSPGGLLEAIQQERIALSGLREESDWVLDTSLWNGVQLRQRLQDCLTQEPLPLTVTLLSFGFKYGIPLDANLVFDVRFLPNPYFVPELRLLTGQDLPIQQFLFGEAVTQSTYHHIQTTVQQFLPHFRSERRSQVTIAIGCTGGQHRSVGLVERLRPALAEALPEGYHWLIHHRHLARSQAELAKLFADPLSASGATPHAQA
ncbi:MAG: RNase adapter RapZ [Cyanobacteriota bacterium]|nr:RNase adapter RapZ [Cyanobacteriota bacterium]